MDAPSDPPELAAVLRAAVRVLLVVVLVSACTSAPAFASTSYVDGVSDQNLAYWGPFFSDGLDGVAPLFSPDPWDGVLPARVAYARYVAQWNQTRPFRAWLEHVPAGVTIDLALTNYDASQSYSPGNPNYPSTPQEYDAALESFLSLAAEVLHRPIATVEPWNEPNNQGGYSAPDEAVVPARFANQAHASCAMWDCSVLAGDVEDIHGEAGTYLHAYRAALDFTPSAWAVHPYRAVDDYGREPSGMAEFEEQCGGCHPWFTEIGVFLCEAVGEKAVYDGALTQKQLAEVLVDRVIPTYEPEHVFYYELKAPATEQAAAQEASCERGDPTLTDTSLYTVDGQPRPAEKVIFGP